MMAWQDRPYSHDDGGRDGGFGGFGGSQLRLAFPPWTPVVKWLIIVNFMVAMVSIFLHYRHIGVPEWINAGSGRADVAIAALDLKLTILHGQVWRLFTFQYLHGGASHLVWNLVGLYFFGPPLERQFGGKIFFWFYTACGVFAAAVFLLVSILLEYIFTGQVTTGWSFMLIGASGGVLGCLAGCAILFPRMHLIIVPIRVAVWFFIGLYLLSVVWDNNLSDAAHLGGMAGAWGWIMIGRRYEGRGGLIGAARQRRQASVWQKKQEKIRKEDEQVDRILAKVKEQGINSLTRREKRTLKQATERQKREEREKDQRMREWGAR